MPFFRLMDGTFVVRQSVMNGARKMLEHIPVTSVKSPANEFRKRAIMGIPADS